MKYIRLDKNELKRKARITGLKAIVGVPTVVKKVRRFIFKGILFTVITVGGFTGFFHFTNPQISRFEAENKLKEAQRQLRYLQYEKEDKEQEEKSSRGFPLSTKVSPEPTLEPTPKPIPVSIRALITKYCAKYGVSTALVTAISRHETGNWTSSAYKQLNNPGGIMYIRGGLRKFSSLDAGIQEMCRLLKTEYIDKGLKSIEQIGKKYCPVGAKNDPKSLNKSWVPTVTQYFNEERR